MGSGVPTRKPRTNRLCCLLLVIQVPDKASQAELIELVTVVEQQWPGLSKYAIVNVFGEHTDLVVGTRTVRYVAPETIEDDHHIRVVLAKEAISTGWDCPRAEVLYSERPASDATHIAQVVGRMVRQPLARRITTDDSLNSVWCYLPKFKLSALAAIVTELNAPGEVGSAAEVVIGAGLFERNQKLNAAVFGAIESVPCLPAPDSLANPVRRAKSLAKLLTDDSREPALLPAAGSELTTRLNNRFAGLSVEHAAAVARNVEDIETMQGRHTVYGLDDADTKAAPRTIATAARDIERDTRRIVASVKEGAAKDYLKHVVETAGAGVDILGERTKVAALVRVPGVVSSIEATADEWVKEQLGWFRVQIKHTTGARKEAFLRVQGQTSTPEPSTSSCRRPSVRQPEHPTPKAPRRYQPFPASSLRRQQRRLPSQAQRVGDHCYRSRTRPARVHRMVPKPISRNRGRPPNRLRDGRRGMGISAGRLPRRLAAPQGQPRRVANRPARRLSRRCRAEATRPRTVCSHLWRSVRPDRINRGGRRGAAGARPAARQRPPRHRGICRRPGAAAV